MGRGELTTNQKGAIAEEAIAAAATKLGIIVCRPNLDARYDLVLDLGDRLLRVQCKWGAKRDDIVVIHTQCSRHTPGRGYVRTTYCEPEVDAIAAYCQELEACYLLPIAEVAGLAAIRLRLAPARNGQRAALRYAADHLLGAVAQLEERRHGMAEVRGSSPLSSTPSTVGAHEFRNRFGWYMQRAAAGETIQVSRRGRPTVRLGPCEVAPPRPP